MSNHVHFIAIPDPGFDSHRHKSTSKIL
jgi:hypothetical protein